MTPINLAIITKRIVSLLNHNSININSVKSIAYGTQFQCFDNDTPLGTVRLFCGKKGPKIDLSQIKNPTAQKQLATLLQTTGYAIVPPTTDTRDHPTLSPQTWPIIGTDESGKGDLFGPLVTAAVYVTQDQETLLRNHGVTDSKRIATTDIPTIAHHIHRLCPYECLILNPIQYNKQYAKTPNLNTVLAQCHATVIDRLHKKTHCHHVLSDQFANPKVLQLACKHRLSTITLHQQTKAESHVAVAAASIVARDAFLTTLAHLSHTYHIPFPKGASHVKKSLQEFIERYGKNKLNEVAKTHFKIIPD